MVKLWSGKAKELLQKILTGFLESRIKIVL